MSAEHLSLARLPITIFSNLLSVDDGNNYCPYNLRSRICEKLFRYVAQVGQLMKITQPALLRILDPLLTHEECQEMIRRICHTCACNPLSTLHLMGKSESECFFKSYNSMINERNLSSGVDSLDRILKGGFRVGVVTEIVGRAGVGKTQLAMQLCIIAGLNRKGSIYIDTENKLNLSRLEEIAKERVRKYFTFTTLSGKKSMYEKKEASELLENIVVNSPRLSQDLFGVISRVEEDIILNNEDALTSSSTVKFPIRLLIIDSIAGPSRREFRYECSTRSVIANLQLAQMLKRIADQLNVAVVVINQISIINVENKKKTDSFIYQSKLSDFVPVTAALGMSWHHSVTMRILLEYVHDPNCAKNRTVELTGGIMSDEDNETSWTSRRRMLRTATITKSNVSGITTISYVIKSGGIYGFS